MGDTQVRVLYSLRAGSAEPASLLGAFAELPAERIEIGPLSVAALHRILSDAIGRSFARPVLVRIAEASRGNPLHALEIARELERRGVEDWRHAPPGPREPRRPGARSRQGPARFDPP